MPSCVFWKCTNYHSKVNKVQGISYHAYINAPDTSRNVVNMNLESLCDLPIVYTTRLDEMVILKQDLSTANPKEIIKAIIYESKPQQKIAYPIKRAKIIKREHDTTNKERKRKHLQRSPSFKLTFKELKSQLDVINNKNKNSANKTEVVIKSEHETFEEFESKLVVMENETNSTSTKNKVVIKSEIETFVELESKLDEMESETNSTSTKNKVAIKSEIETFEELESKLDEMESGTNSASTKNKVAIKSEIETFEELESKLVVIESETNSASTKNEVAIKSEIETDINSEGTNKLESLLALCKPLKIVLIDIGKIPPKIKNENKPDILNISSDSDDDVVLIKQKKINPISKSDISAGKTFSSTSNFVIKNINDFKNILMEMDLRDCVIVIYNLFRKDLDAYQIDNCYKVTDYTTKKYTEVNKFPMKRCELVINIISCCWKKRQLYISILLTYDKYIDIARFIKTTHPCTETCTCCCVSEQSTEPQDAINKFIENHTIAIDSQAKISNTCGKGLKLIELALKYEKKSKWKGYPEGASDFNLKNRPICDKLLQFSNTNGKTEFYEFGRDDVIYSKIVKDSADKSSWLHKTMTHCLNRDTFKLRTLIDREKCLLPFKHTNNIISYEAECFLRNAIPIKILEKTKQYCEEDVLMKYKVRHVRNFIEASYKKLKILSIISEMRQPVPPPPVAKQKQSQPKKPRSPQPNPNITDEQFSGTIDHLIKDILHRFRDVFLTINADGKVAAALNAPLSTLSHSELKILSEILHHAQIQVDKLGLKPGTSWNANEALAFNSTGETSSIQTKIAASSEVVATDSEKAVEHNIQSSEEKYNNNNKKENNKFLTNFSRIIAHKKKEYEISFRSYLGDTVEPSPKITNVFSLNVTNCITSNVLETRSDNTVLMTETDGVASVKNPEIFINEMSEKTIMDNNTMSNIPNERKRKTYPPRHKKQPKIRIKTAAEIIVDNPSAVDTSFVTSDINNIQCYPIPSVPLTAIDIIPGASYIPVPANIPLKDVRPELETFQVLSLPVNDPVIDNPKFLVVHADGKMSEISQIPIS